MPNQAFVELLTDLHRSIDRVAEELVRDRPALAAALRQRASWIPRPEEVVDPPRPPANEACRAIPPLLYDALDAGAIDGAKFDALMITQKRARDALAARAR